MRICWKSFLLSFCVALLLFSLLMTGICLGVFEKFVPKAEHDPLTGSSSDLVGKRACYESCIFYCDDKDGQALDFALLIRVDPGEKKVLATNLSGDVILERQGKLFYIRSLCETYGKKELSPIFAALTGYEVSTERILNARDYMPSEKNATVRHLDFLELLPKVLDAVQEDFAIVECPLVIEENQGVQVVNIEKSLETLLRSK